MSILSFPGRSSRDPHSRVQRVEALLAENETPLIRYAARLLGTHSEGARDVVQEAFLRLCRQEDLGEVGREWLFTVTRNLCIDHRRKEGRMTPTDEIENVHAGRASVHGTSDLSPQVERRDLASALDRLPERSQEALRLKFEAGLSYAEIARVLDTSTGNVGWILHNAIKGLKARLAPEGGAR